MLKLLFKEAAFSSSQFLNDFNSSQCAMCFLLSQQDPFNVGTWNSHLSAERNPSFDRNEKYNLDRKLNTYR